MDLEQTAIERLRFAAEMSLRVYKQPLVITYSGGKDSDCLLRLAQNSGIPFEVLHSLTTADAPETVRHVKDTFRKLEIGGVKCTIDTHKRPDGTNVTMWNLIPRKLIPPTRWGALLLRGTQGNRRKRAVYRNRRPLGRICKAEAIAWHYGDYPQGQK